MKNYVIIAILSVFIGLGLGSYLFPRVQKEVVEVEKEVIKKDVRTIIKEVIKKDGTKEVETVIIDNTKETKQSKSTETVLKPDWHANVGVSHSFKEKDMVYSLTVERRIVGDLFVGATVNSEKTVGVTLGLEF